MKRNFFYCCLLLLIAFTANVWAQERVTTVGICYRPIFPVAFLGTGPETVSDLGVSVTTELNKGFSGGMMIRRGFSDLLAGEIGINYVNRKYGFSITDSAFNGKGNFSLVGYEIPISLLVFIKLGEQVYMNASMGTGIDAFASSVRTSTDTYNQVAIKKYVAIPSLNANLGWEYRTEKSGIIYLGATYHRPLSDIYSSYVNYRNNGKDLVFSNQLSGTYLTVDLRYYFHEDREKIHKKKK